MHYLTQLPLLWPTFQGRIGQNVKINRTVNQSSTNRNCHTDLHPVIHTICYAKHKLSTLSSNSSETLQDIHYINRIVLKKLTFSISSKWNRSTCIACTICTNIMLKIIFTYSIAKNSLNTRQRTHTNVIVPCTKCRVVILQKSLIYALYHFIN